MKSAIITKSSILIIALAFLMSACKKEDLRMGNNGYCKSTEIDWGGLFKWDFSYNEKGLADVWAIDYGEGNINIFKIKYDQLDRLASSNGYDAAGNLLYTTSFTYHGIRMTSQSWSDILNGTQSVTTFTYNNKGEIVREDDEADDLHYFLTYDNIGNCTKSDGYIGEKLYFSDNYEFKVPVINPLLTVTGITFMFPYSGAGYFNKLWFSRNLTYTYDDKGISYETNDFKASANDFIRKAGDFPASVNYYDAVSASSYLFTFGYSCDEKRILPMIDESKNTILKKTTFFGPPTIIKKQLIALRKQYAGK